MVTRPSLVDLRLAGLADTSQTHAATSSPARLGAAQGKLLNAIRSQPALDVLWRDDNLLDQEPHDALLLGRSS
ncbi:MAG: hypothetical protein M3461_15255 [Pseudomonadota bacterium]|nr:hypothetical protein [Pseudomonadota bacterium]